MKSIPILLFIVLLSACSINNEVLGTDSQKEFSYEQSIIANAFSPVSLSETGDVKILDVKAVVEKGVVSSVFVLDAPVEGRYYLSLFMIPEDRSSYHIECNDEYIEGVLKPQKTGWQTIHFMAENGRLSQIPLKRGINEVAVYSNSNDYPEISVFKMTMSGELSDISTKDYEEYIRKVITGELNTKEIQSVATKANSTLNSVDYQYQLGCPLLYSFTKTIVLTSGNNSVTVSSMSPVLGTIVVDIFKDNVYTWKGVFTEASGVTQNFPPGVYTVHLRCLPQVNPFLAPIRISYTGNVNYNYSLAPISGYSFVTQADSYTGGQVNYFTCHTSSGADPIMYLENGLGATVGSTNNNYSGTGDFDWTVNARIKTSYSGAPLVHIFNASANIPEGTCDLYVRIPFHSNTTQDIYDYFNLTWNSLIGLCPSIKADDTMLSGALNSTYNCIGWSGDLLDYVWPTQSFSAYYYPGVAEIVAFDLYYEDRGYTIVGATAANAGVALWLTNTGYVTHASITNNSRSIYPHGFDWESKLGAYSPRVFHEKDALVGDAYGTIQRYYRPDPDAPAMVTTTENATFSLNARNLLQDLQNSRNTEELNRLFSNLYDAWSDYCHSPEVMIQSNPETLKSDDSYRELMSLCHKEPNSHLLVVDKLIKGDFKAGFLLDDIIPSEYAYLKRDAYHHYQKGMKEIPTMLANFYRLAEAYLNEINK